MRQTTPTIALRILSDHLLVVLTKVVPPKRRWCVGLGHSCHIRRAGGSRTLEDRNILAMMIQKKFGEITLELTDEQYAKLRKS